VLTTLEVDILSPPLIYSGTAKTDTSKVSKIINQIS